MRINKSHENIDVPLQFEFVVHFMLHKELFISIFFPMNGRLKVSIKHDKTEENIVVLDFMDVGPKVYTV